MSINIGQNCEIVNTDFLAGMRRIPDASVDCVITDPPYCINGMDENWCHDKLKSRSSDKSSMTASVKGLPSSMRYDPLQAMRLEHLMNGLGSESSRVMKPGAFLVVFSANRLIGHVTNPIEKAGFRIWDVCPWYHGCGQPRAQSQHRWIDKMAGSNREREILHARVGNLTTPQLRPVCELIVVAQKWPIEGTFLQNFLKWGVGLATTWFDNRSQGTVFEFSKPRGNDHMSPKPLDLMQRLVEIYSIPGHVVLDPFMGSGTTGVAALSVGRRFIGFDKDPNCFDMALCRIRGSARRDAA